MGASETCCAGALNAEKSSLQLFHRFIDMLRMWITAVLGIFFIFSPTELPAGQSLSDEPNYEVRNFEALLVIDLVAKLDSR